MKKIVDLENYRRIILRRLSKDITPVSFEVKEHCWKPKCFGIIRKAEKQFMNECVRIKIYTIELCWF